MLLQRGLFTWNNAMAGSGFLKNAGAPRKIAVFLFFGALLLAGLGLFRSYGVPWDEAPQRDLGIQTYSYVFAGDETLLASRDRNYGPVFEFLLVLPEKALALKDARDIIFARHLGVFIVFYTGVVFFYLLAGRIFRSWKFALLGSLFLVLSPRVFANAFYNSKDIPCMAFFIISAYTMVRFLDRKTPAAALTHGLACAVLVDIRIVGVIMPLLTLFLLVDDLWTKRAVREERNKILADIPLFLTALGLFTVLFWPVLWRDPVGNFIRAFKEMSYYPFTVTVLYAGKYMDSTGVPWHYVPVWLSISTPLLYVVFFMAGLVVLAGKLVRNAKKRDPVTREELIFLYWFFAPVAAVMALGSALYDAWRQMFFIYPAFLLISMTGLKAVFERLSGAAGKALKAAFIAIVAACLLQTVFFMAGYHPHQNVYFNALAGSMTEAKSDFDLDYWGLSYRKALEYIAANDDGKVVTVYAANFPGILNSFILPRGDRKRLVFVDDPAKAKYFVSAYRWHKEEYPYPNEVYSVKVGPAKIAVVYKLK